MNDKTLMIKPDYFKETENVGKFFKQYNKAIIGYMIMNGMRVIK
jgi:hypothetical protein